LADALTTLRGQNNFIFSFLHFHLRWDFSAHFYLFLSTPLLSFLILTMGVFLGLAFFLRAPGD